MTEGCPCNDSAFLSTVDGYRALPRLLRLLATGEPVDLEELVGVAGDDGADLARVVRSQPGSEWDDDGRLVGFGLTTRATNFRFDIAGRALYTWCAADTLFFAVILGEPAVVESACPDTGVGIRFAITPDGVTSVAPPDAVVSQRHRLDLVANLRSDICDHGHFFASPSAAASWIRDHPDGRVVSIAAGFGECRTACQELGWVSSEVPGS